VVTRGKRLQVTDVLARDPIFPGVQGPPKLSTKVKHGTREPRPFALCNAGQALPKGVLLERRDGEVERSKCHRESRWIEHETWLIAETHGLQVMDEWRADVQPVSYCERVLRTFEDRKGK